MFEFYQAPVWRFTKARIGQDQKENNGQRQPKAHDFSGVNKLSKEGKLKQKKRVTKKEAQKLRDDKISDFRK